MTAYLQLTARDGALQGAARAVQRGVYPLLPLVHIFARAPDERYSEPVVELVAGSPDQFLVCRVPDVASVAVAGECATGLANVFAKRGPGPIAIERDQATIPSNFLDPRPEQLQTWSVQPKW